jgi:hypothetical protein
MAVIINNRIGIFANELIAYNPKTGIGSRDGFISKPSYDKMKRIGQLTILCRSTPNSSAIVDFETMRPDIIIQYTQRNGDPRAALAVQSHKGALEAAVIYSNEASEYYTTKYRYDGDKKLPPEKVDEYTVNARVIEAILALRDTNLQKKGVGSGTSRFNRWERLSEMTNELATLRDAHGRQLFPHTLPMNAAALKRKCVGYEQARSISREEAFRYLIHKNYGNKCAALVTDPDMEAVLHKLISHHNNLNNVQIMDDYNKIAGVMGMKLITNPGTVANYKKKMELTTMLERRGEKEVANTRKKQVHRTPPTQAMTYWTLDGWTVELLYQKKSPRKGKNKKGEETNYNCTTYTNRKTVVVVMDACGKYPIGYAIGDHESPALIMEALRDAVRNTIELFGSRYYPVQIQSDHYAEGQMFPFYDGVAKYNTPAAIGNAKSKIIEPYFRYLNVKYCQPQANWSGFGITARRENQPNIEVLNENRHCIPDEATVIGQIEVIMEKERALKREAYLNAWAQTQDDRKLPMSDEKYLLRMGVVGKRTHKITGNGLHLEIGDRRYLYDSFDVSLREHYNEEWLLRYDPADMSKVLVSNAVRKGMKDAGTEIGNLRYLIQEDVRVPMALADQKAEHFEYRQKVNEFNNELMEHITGKNDEVNGRIENLRERIPELVNNKLLDRYLLTNSRGQHKDERTKMRGQQIEDASYEEVAERVPTMLPSGDTGEEDYEFDPSLMNFSR